jgi:hypothetical protein
MVDDNEDTNDSDIEEQVDDILLHNCLLHQLGAHLIASVFLTSLLEEKKRREASLFDQRLNWERFCQKHGDRKGFNRHMRMLREAFNQLLSFLRNYFEVNSSMASI